MSKRGVILYCTRRPQRPNAKRIANCNLQSSFCLRFFPADEVGDTQISVSCTPLPHAPSLGSHSLSTNVPKSRQIGCCRHVSNLRLPACLVVVVDEQQPIHQNLGEETRTERTGPWRTNGEGHAVDIFEISCILGPNPAGPSCQFKECLC